MVPKERSYITSYYCSVVTMCNYHAWTDGQTDGRAGGRTCAQRMLNHGIGPCGPMYRDELKCEYVETVLATVCLYVILFTFYYGQRTTRKQ